MLEGLLNYPGDRKNQRLNWHQLVLVTRAVKKWPPSFNLKPGWVSQQMCLHGDTAVKKWGDVLEKAGAYIKVAAFIHPSPLHRINLCHICQIYPSLGITALAERKKKKTCPSLIYLFFILCQAWHATVWRQPPSSHLFMRKYFHNQNAQLRIKHLTLDFITDSNEGRRVIVLRCPQSWKSTLIMVY